MNNRKKSKEKKVFAIMGQITVVMTLMLFSIFFVTVILMTWQLWSISDQVVTHSTNVQVYNEMINERHAIETGSFIGWLMVRLGASEGGKLLRWLLIISTFIVEATILYIFLRMCWQNIQYILEVRRKKKRRSFYSENGVRDTIRRVEQTQGISQ